LKLKNVLCLLVFAGVLCAQEQASPSHAEFTRRLIAAAVERTHHSVRYVSDYVRIAYPGGDVPADTGVCTDEIIRSYRAVGVDLQKEIHEDMVRNFDRYPHKWPGDIVAWDLGGGITHVGIVVDRKSSNGSNMVVHNIGRGPQMEDVLFDWKIIGHYRYYGP
jgi:uncharacterized protein